MGINFLAVLAAVVIRMGLGAFWFSPSGFGKQWMGLMGITKEKMDEEQKKGGMWKLYAIECVAAVVTSFVLAFLLSNGLNSAAEGALAGFLLWAGLVAAFNVSDYTWGGRPTKLFWITSGYHLVSLVLMGAVLAGWR